MSDLEAFLAGRAPDHVAMVLADEVLAEPEALDAYAERLEGGLALVLPGADGRSAFQRATGRDPMGFARAASDREGRVARDLSAGDCPATGEAPEDAHHPHIVFAFAEARHEDADGLYAEGPVVHAYVQCACGALYADRWVVEG